MYEAAPRESAHSDIPIDYLNHLFQSLYSTQQHFAYFQALQTRSNMAEQKNGVHQVLKIGVLGLGEVAQVRLRR